MNSMEAGKYKYNTEFDPSGGTILITDYVLELHVDYLSLSIEKDGSCGWVRTCGHRDFIWGVFFEVGFVIRL